MPTRSLPPQPDLTQLKLQAKELQRAHAAGSRAAAARILAHHPKPAGPAASDIPAAPLSLSAAQLVIAREYGFRSWADLKHRVELERTVARIEPHPRFDEALAAFDRGDAPTLAALLADDALLIHARTNLEPPVHYFTGATLLHHVAGNPWRAEVVLPENVVELARLMLEAGADPNAETLGPNGGTTMGLLVTGNQASERGVTGPLMDLLLVHGAELDLDDPGALDTSLTNHAPAAAEKMIELGVEPDLFAAAALGRMDHLRNHFDEAGRLRTLPWRDGKELTERDAIGRALLHAYVRDQKDAVDFLLEKDGNWDVTGVNNGTALHRAAWSGDLDMIRRLVERGADIGNRDNPFGATPLSWAHHNRQQAVFDWFREHCAIDIHDAVSFGLLEQVEARLRDDPSSATARRDHWNMPGCTPLHCAAFGWIGDVEGRQKHDPEEREALARILLDAGAGVNALAGNGLTPLDIAVGTGAARVAAVLRARGGRAAAEL